MAWKLKKRINRLFVGFYRLIRKGLKKLAGFFKSLFSCCFDSSVKEYKPAFLEVPVKTSEYAEEEKTPREISPKGIEIRRSRNDVDIARIDELMQKMTINIPSHVIKNPPRVRANTAPAIEITVTPPEDNTIRNENNEINKA